MGEASCRSKLVGKGVRGGFQEAAVYNSPGSRPVDFLSPQTRVQLEPKAIKYGYIIRERLFIACPLGLVSSLFPSSSEEKLLVFATSPKAGIGVEIFEAVIQRCSLGGRADIIEAV